MSKRPLSLFYADNKDILDHFLAYEAFKSETLRRIAWERGIVLSQKNSKVELAQYVSLFSFDRDQLDALLDETSIAERQLPSTMQSIGLAVGSELIQSAASSLRTGHELKNEEFQIATSKEGVITVKVTYAELKNSRNRLDQKTIRTATIDIEPEGDSIRVRSTAGKKTDGIVNELVDAISKMQNEENPAPKPVRIDLSGIRNPSHRTKFFLRLFNDMVGFENSDVSDIRVSHLDDKPTNEDADDEPSNSAPNRNQKQSHELRNAIKQAVLEGQNILQTKIYQDLTKQGYYITRACWRATDVLHTEVDFEAWFQDTQNAADFRYRVRSVSTQDEGHQGHHQRPDSTTEQKLIRVLEDVVHKSFEAARESLEGSQDSGVGK